MPNAIEQIEIGERVAKRGSATITERPTASVSSCRSSIGLPEDAREWVDPCTLSLLVQDEVEAVSFCRSVAGVGGEGRRLYELLTYAYAAGLLASEEIAAACRTNAGFRFLSRGAMFFAEELTRFRRRHRGELETLLTRVLARVAGTSGADVRPVVYLELLRNARGRLDTARHLDLDV